jgi:hypothetical protein
LARERLTALATAQVWMGCSPVARPLAPHLQSLSTQASLGFDFGPFLRQLEHAFLKRNSQ